MNVVTQPLPADPASTPVPVTPAGDPPSQRAGPPFGVQVIVVLVLLRPLVEARGVWRALAPGSTVASRIAGIDRLAAPEALPWMSVGLLLIAMLILAIGLWRGAGWAWSLTIIGTGLFMARDLYLYATAVPAVGDATPWRAWIGGLPLYTSMLLDTVTVIYFNQREVKHAFGLEQPKRLQEAP